MLRKLLIALLFMPFTGFAQLVVTNPVTQTPLDLVQNVLLGAGVTVTNVTFNGGPANVWSEQAGFFDSNMANVGIPTGVILATGDVTQAAGPNTSGSNSLGGGTLSSPGTCDPDLQLLDPNATGFNDCAVLEFDFVPTGDSLKFNFVFASEEYLEFVNSINDAFGFFISGPGFAGPYANGAENIALVPGTATPITINTVNDVVNSAYYVDNGDGFTAPFNVDPFYIQFDGLTTVMTAEALVQCGQTYHIKIAVADANDTAWDSAVFLEAGSFTSTGQVAANLTPSLTVNDTTMLESCLPVEFTFQRLGDTTFADTISLIIGGTATAGVDYLPALPSQLIFLPGDTLITYTFTVPNDPDVGPETITITINQNIICSGSTVQTNYVFYIIDPPPLAVIGNNVNITCGQSVQIGGVASGGFGAYSYLWSTGATTDSIMVSPSVTTDYIVTVTDTCGLGPVSDTITVTLPVYAPMQIQLTPDTAIPCLTNVDLNVISLTGGNGVYTYAWSDAAGTLLTTSSLLTVPAGVPTYYYMTATDGCGDSVTDSVLVSTAVLPPVEIFTADTIIPLCIGDTLILDVDTVIGGNGVYTYQWSLNNNNVGTGNQVPVGVNSTLTYTVTVNDQCGYSDTALLTLAVPQYDPLTLEVLPSDIICLGESIDLYAWVDGGSGFYNIVWPTVMDAGGLPYTDPTFTATPVDEITFYPVWVVDVCGEIVGDSTLIVAESIETDIVVTQSGQDDVTLFGASEPPGQSYHWDMGDGTRYRGQNVAHSYLNIEDDFNVMLIVTTPNGCVDTTWVLIQPPAHAYFPNAFTPDGDGVNDFFTPVYHDLDILEMVIFDRWGHEVFNSLNTGSLTWDGTVNGDGIATPAVYVYWYRVAGHLLPNYDGYGHVTLVR